MWNSIMMLTFSVFNHKYLSWTNLVQKFKIVSSKLNLIQRLIWACKIQWLCLFHLFYNVFISFRRSIRMFVIAFIEYVDWPYWWTWCALPITCNFKHFSFFVFHFNKSNKISSTPTRLSSFQFSNHPLPPTPSPHPRYPPLPRCCFPRLFLISSRLIFRVD